MIPVSLLKMVFVAMDAYPYTVNPKSWSATKTITFSGKPGRLPMANREDGYPNRSLSPLPPFAGKLSTYSTAISHEIPVIQYPWNIHWTSTKWTILEISKISMKYPWNLWHLQIRHLLGAQGAGGHEVDVRHLAVTSIDCFFLIQRTTAKKINKHIGERRS